MRAPRGLGRTALLRVRLTARERQLYDGAAGFLDVPLSTWVRLSLRAAAVKTLSDNNQTELLQRLIGK